MMDKVFILNELKRHKGFKSNAEFARFLQLSPQNLANWYKRNTFDLHLLANLFTDVNASWIETGEGEMLRDDTEQKDDIATLQMRTIENMSETINRQSKIIETLSNKL